MKTKTIYLSFALVTLLLLTAITQSYALNYTITFTGSGASTTVGDVIVQNLTKGTTVTVPTGNSLNLSDAPNGVEQLNANDERIRVYPNSMEGKSTVSFFAKQTGSTQLNAFSLDGRKIIGINQNLQEGLNSFQLTLPKGAFSIQVVGNRYTYTAKIINQTSVQNNPGIVYIGTEKTVSSSPQKSKSSAFGITTMTYTTGDQLLYTATSGIYIASVPDVPTGGKTINFNFATIPTSAIPAGTFTMGSPVTEVDRQISTADETQHSVTLSAFRMSKYEITNAQYASFLNAKSIGSNGLYAAGAFPTRTLIYSSSIYGVDYDFGLHYSGSQWIPVAGYENAPVIFVTWYGSTEFATYVGGSLPTEAQWEYACRAGTSTSFSTGDFLTNLQANYNWEVPYNGGTNSVTTYPGKTQPVGTYSPNAYGLYDMHGNVYEWCSDWCGKYPTSAQTNPIGAPTGPGRVNRGGGWYYGAKYCRSANRNYSNPTEFTPDFGFRVVIPTTSSATLPTLSTSAITSISSTSASCGGDITNDGGVTITARGICWSTSATPTTALSTKTTETGNTGAFTSSMNNLTANTTYYVRAYATNTGGTAYGAEVSFTTLPIPADGFYITGNASAFTTIDIGGQFKSTINEVDFSERIGLVEKYVALESGKTFTITEVLGSNKNIYGAGNNFTTVDQQGNNDEMSGSLQKGNYTLGSTFSVPISGLYHVVIDKQTASVLIMPVSKWAIIGSATPLGWSDNDMLAKGTFSKDTMVYEINNITLLNGEFKLRHSGAWKQTIVSNPIVKVCTNFGGTTLNTLVPGGINIPLSTVNSGTYTVTGSWGKNTGMKFSMSKTGNTVYSDPANAIYSIIGDAFNNASGTPAAWDYDLDLVYDATLSTITDQTTKIGTYVFKANNVKLFAGGLFRIRKSHLWEKIYGYIAENIKGDTSNFVNGDGNIKVLTTTTYSSVEFILTYPEETWQLKFTK